MFDIGKGCEASGGFTNNQMNPVITIASVAPCEPAIFGTMILSQRTINLEACHAKGATLQ